MKIHVLYRCLCWSRAYFSERAGVRSACKCLPVRLAALTRAVLEFLQQTEGRHMNTSRTSVTSASGLLVLEPRQGSTLQRPYGR